MINLNADKEHVYNLLKFTRLIAPTLSLQAGKIIHLLGRVFTIKVRKPQVTIATYDLRCIFGL